ncbi:hypothetical protein ACFZBE_40545 [Streptomyces sp. NPDC008061]|uniref:hypothetical protein n=1 Tax=Streptomyces sp. NPDC008061 TaxID=3364805 RepID=UPI0036E0E383
MITTIPDPPALRAPALVDHDFVALAPNRCWVADFTHVATFSGVVYVAVVLDTFSHRIRGLWTSSLDEPRPRRAQFPRQGAVTSGATHRRVPDGQDRLVRDVVQDHLGVRAEEPGPRPRGPAPQ